jgi:peptidyl-prolyl cis-trans isomerase A (cyclophilin A)
MHSYIWIIKNQEFVLNKKPMLRPIFFLFCIISTISLQAQPLPAALDLKTQSPDSFVVEFKTSKGNFSITAHRSWSPLACDRFFILVKNNWYNNTVIYRVAPTKSYKGGKIVQFGLSNNSAVNHAWNNAGIKDEPVAQPHEWGAVCFARDSVNSRSTDIAIFLAHGITLDTINYRGVIGFPTFAMVTAGKDVVQSFNGEYGNDIMELPDDSLFLGREFFDRRFPGLDLVYSAAVIKSWGR